MLERTGQNKSSLKKYASTSPCTKTGASPSLTVASAVGSVKPTGMSAPACRILLPPCLPLLSAALLVACRGPCSPSDVPVALLPYIIGLFTF